MEGGGIWWLTLEAILEPNGTSTMELSSENSYQLLALNYFSKKAHFLFANARK